MQSTSVGSGEG